MKEIQEWAAANTGWVVFGAIVGGFYFLGGILLVGDLITRWRSERRDRRDYFLERQELNRKIGLALDALPGTIQRAVEQGVIHAATRVIEDLRESYLTEYYEILSEQIRNTVSEALACEDVQEALRSTLSEVIKDASRNGVLNRRPA